MKLNILKWVISVWWLVFSCVSVDAGTIKIATYNVENLFDAVKSGTEYPEYDPEGPYGWNLAMADIKAANIARVLTSLNSDIVCLQEIESGRALSLLLNKLEVNGTPYPYAAIADKTKTTVKCAVISKCPIIKQQEISPGKNMRGILQVTVKFEDHPLILFVNHWKSKQGPESLRMVYAKALKSAVDRLAPDDDYIIAGDFNANYNEYITIRDEPRLNDTNGRTGINHVLETVINGRIVTEAMLTNKEISPGLYNLWLELPPHHRWSHNFFGRKNSLDNIILSRGLYDVKGVSYVDNSFEKFDPAFLFKRGQMLFRWQQTNNGRGSHLGKGYSDHLPLFALFSTDPFYPGPKSPPWEPSSEERLSSTVPVSALYEIDPGAVSLHIKHCQVIYKHRDNAIIKQPAGRAIYVYQAARKLKYGHVYDLMVKQLCDYHGLKEICAFDIISTNGSMTTVSDLLLHNTTIDLNDRIYQNEILEEINGVFRDGHLYYGDGRRIRLYFKERNWKPPEKATVILKNVRIGCHRTPELTIEKKEQIHELLPRK